MPGRPALLGELLDGRYRIDSSIARGGMSTVYRGVDIRLDRPVAVKVMDPSFADDPEFQSRFEFEARSVARLSHSGLVAVHDQGTDGGHAFLVMELVEGGTLRELLRERGRLDVAAALAVLEPALAALATAHRAGLVHRDVKPENVLLTDDGTVKVADFGLVRAIAAAGATSSGVILGTAAYLSPEQVTTGAADPRSDVYSAGVLLFELLTGRPPYSGDTALSVAYQHVNAQVPAPSTLVPGVPAELDHIVLRATRHEPGDRFRDAGEMLGELIAVRRHLGLRRVRVTAPVRSAEHLSAPGRVQHTRAMTTGIERPARGPAATLRPDDTDELPTLSAYQSQRRRARRTALVWVLVVALVTAAVGLGAWWLGSGQFTAVPQLRGLDRTAAGQVLDDADLDAVVRTGYDDAAARDVVLGAEPEAGTKVQRGSDVLVTVSLGRPRVPEVEAGTGGSVVEQLLREATLQPQQTAGAYDDTVPEGALLSLDPPAGTELAVGSAVQVTLSRGPAPVAVPEVAGRPAQEARELLAGAGLTTGRTVEEFSATVPGGAVVRTDPPASAETRRGTVVTLVVSDAVTVPGLFGRTVGSARQALADLGLQVEVSRLLPTDTALVISQSPDGGSPVAPGSTVTITAFP